MSSTRNAIGRPIRSSYFMLMTHPQTFYDTAMYNVTDSLQC